MPKKRVFSTLFLSWLGMLGWDFFLHGGLLASFYVADDPFLLAPLEAFRRIPIGYASFFLLAFLLYSLMPRYEISNWRQALAFGLKAGALIWGTLLLGLYSISTISPVTAIAWFLGQSTGMGIAALLIHLATHSASLKRLTWWTIAFVIAAFIMTFVLQNLGFAPQVIL